MIGRYFCQDRDIRNSDREEEVHLQWVIDAVFEDEVSRKWEENTRDTLQEYVYPLEDILPACFCSYDGERESILSIVVIMGEVDIVASIYL